MLTFAAYILTVVVMEITPGPNMMWLATVAATRGRRTAFYAVAGVTLGLSFYLVVALLGIVPYGPRDSVAYQLLRWAGALFLLYLAYDAWRPHETQAVATGASRTAFVRGFVTNLLNPKAAIFYLVLLPSYISPVGPSEQAQIAALGAIHLAISVVIHSTIVVLASGIESSLRKANGAEGALFRACIAGALIASAAWTAFGG